MRTYLIYLLLACVVLAVNTGSYAQEKKERNPFLLPAPEKSEVKEKIKENSKEDGISKVSTTGIVLLNGRRTMILDRKIVREGEDSTDGVEIKKELSNMDFVDAEIGDVLRILAEEFKLNIVAGTDIKGKVTVSFSNVTLDDALASILRVNGYDYVKKDNIISVIKLGQPGVETESRVFTLKHVDAANVKASLITMLSQYGAIETMVRKNGVGSEKTKDRSKTLIVTDVPGNLRKIEEVITQLDTPSAQVLIETKIVEVGLGQDKSLGIDWNIQAAISGSRVPTTFPMPNNGINIGIPGPTPNSTSFPKDKIFPYSSSGDFSFGMLDFADFSAVLQAMQGKTK